MLDTRHFPPEYRGKYPHMFPGDVEVWERFLDKYGNLYTDFQYDIMCGKEYEQFPRWEEVYNRDAAILSKLRIDALGYRPDGIDIIEVKPRAGSAAIGQILTYKEHYDNEKTNEISTRAVIVTGQADPNLIAIAEKLKVLYIVV